MPPPRCTSRLLVTGGTGNLGGHVLSRLRGRDVVIRALSRRPQLTVPAVEHVVADLTRRGTLDSALGVSRMPVIPVPKQFRCQPIDAREVADKLVELALGEPRGRAPDIGGPERTTWAAMVRDYVGMTGRRRSVLEVPMPGMRSVRAGALLVGPDAEPDGPYGQTTRRAFLQTRLHGEAVRR